MMPIIDMQPPAGLDLFLKKHGWAGADVLPVAGDASFRRYFRVISVSGSKAILMDAPPPHEDPGPFIEIAEYLTGAGFRAPTILATDLSRGLVLLEDFGDRRMREHLDEHPEEERATYQQAIDTIIRLSGTDCPDLPPYDEAAYLREVQLFTQWYMPSMGLPVDPSSFDSVWREALAPVATWQSVTVLRDYHAENVMLLDDGNQGIIDFQDALIGHPAYDLVSLLQDARREVSPEFESEMLKYYEDAVQADKDFGLHYALLGAQRNTKIIGIFTRLWKRDGKDRYLGFLPRMWSLLERDLNHPGLGALKDWFDTHVPQDLRRQSPDQVVSA